eukprot:2903721-Pleurochrysis_carterae.AAC.2
MPRFALADRPANNCTRSVLTRVCTSSLIAIYTKKGLKQGAYAWSNRCVPRSTGREDASESA